MRKVLILGKSARDSAFAKNIAKSAEVFVIPGNPSISEFATIPDIEISDTTSIIDFVMENDISLTIVSDYSFATQELINKFEANNLQIFVPNLNFINLLKDKLAVKKLLYKLRITTPRFASFDKTSVAYDYVKNLKNPVIIKSNINEFATICVNEKIAKTAIDDLILRGENVLIEEYINGQTFSIYFVTDGYKILPLGTAQNYNFSLEGDGGILTNGIGASSPYYKLTDGHIDFLTNSVANLLIEHFEQQENPLVGIFGLEVILTGDDRLFISNVKPFISDADAQGILALLDIDILKLIDDCLLGIFADTYEFIPLKDQNALSVVLSARNNDEIIEGLKNLDEDTLVSFYNINKNKYLEYETQKGKVLNLTVLAGTISRGREKLYKEVEDINFTSKTYRKDIGAIMAGNRGLL